MSRAFKLFDPNTGLITYRNCADGVELTEAQVATIAPCPQYDLETSDVCIQPIGNEDPLLIETGGKQACMYKTTFNPDGTANAPVLESTALTNAAGDDVTATHETTACPVGLMPVGEVCFDDGGK